MNSYGSYNPTLISPPHQTNRINITDTYIADNYKSMSAGENMGKEGTSCDRLFWGGIF